MNGGKQPAPRVQAGAGHHPEVDVAVGGDALLEHEARLDERLQRQQLDELGDVRLAVAREVRAAVRRVEAVAAGLRAELALRDELLHALRDVEALGPVGLGEVLGDVQHRVEAEQVHEVVRADRHDVGRADALVDRLDREALLLLRPPDLADAGVEDPVDDEARDLEAGDRLLADRLRERHGRLQRLGRGLVALDDLDQRHDRRRVEVVEADDLVGPQRRVADLGDRQRRGVRGEDRVAGRAGVELGEDRLLDLHPLRARPRRRSRRRRTPSYVVVPVIRPSDLLDLRGALLLGQLALLDELADLALR